MSKTEEGLRNLMKMLESLDELEAEIGPAGDLVLVPESAVPDEAPEPGFLERFALPPNAPPGQAELNGLVEDFFRKKGPAIMEMLPPGSHKLLFIEDYGFMRFQ